MNLLDGRVASPYYLEQIQQTVAARTLRGDRPPHLAAILIGHNGASETYVASKIRHCAQVGFRSTLIRLPDTVSERELLSRISLINEDESIDGLIVQLPLPAHIAPERVTMAISPDKDVDGFHPENLGRIAKGLGGFAAATPLGIQLLLAYYHLPMSGRRVTIIGRSQIVGLPMSVLLSRAGQGGDATVTLCHSRTADLPSHTRQADVLIAALGRPGFVTAEMVAEGAVVIDVGLERVEDTSRKSGYRLAGDVRFDEVAPKASWITPVPGGVGLMTICGLLTNTLEARGWPEGRVLPPATPPVMPSQEA